jgi:hypothetical protein
MTGILCCLTFLTKQDFGLTSIALSILIIVKVHFNPDTNSLYKNFKLKDNKNFLIKITLFLLGFIIPIVLSILIFETENLQYWFNLGQEPHNIQNRINIYSFLVDSYLHIGVFATLCITYLIHTDNFRLAICVCFLFLSELTVKSSGLFFTHFYFVGFLPVIFYEFYISKEKLKQILIFVLIVASLYKISKPIKYSYFIYSNLLNGAVEHFFFDKNEIRENLKAMPLSFQSFSSKTHYSKSVIELISLLKKEILNKQGTTKAKVLNISELTPIYAENKVEPPKNLPLWFHTRDCLFPKEIMEINKILKGNYYDYIILQASGEKPNDKNYLKFLQLIKNNIDYKLYHVVDDISNNKIYTFKKM